MKTWKLPIFCLFAMIYLVSYPWLWLTTKYALGMVRVMEWFRDDA